MRPRRVVDLDRGNTMATVPGHRARSECIVGDEPSRGSAARMIAAAQSPRVRLAVLAVVVVGVAVVIAVVGGPRRDAIVELVRGTGAAAPIVFVVLYAGLTVLLLPGSVLTIAGGLLFGPAVGTALAVVGATAGATASFLLGRRLGREQVIAIAGERVTRIDDWLGQRGFLAVLYLRLIPVLPFNVLNYASGVTALRLRDYLAGTLLGIIPGTFAYAALGGSFDDPTSPVFIAAVVLLVVLAVGAPLVERTVRRRKG